MVYFSDPKRTSYDRTVFMFDQERVEVEKPGTTQGKLAEPNPYKP
jgi:hypothetical protein